MPPTIFFFIIPLFPIVCTISELSLLDQDSMKTIVKRQSGFSLAQLDNQETMEGLDAQDVCKQKCNTDLLEKLDEVKVYGGFGNLGVPDTFDKENLDKFCRADSEHDRCILACGFMIQFNVRDFVCKTHYDKMVSFLPCYKQAAVALKEQCEDKDCGRHRSYTPDVDGYANRCTGLVCYLKCATSVLSSRCVGRLQGKQAAQYLRNFTNYQVNTWSETWTAQMLAQGKTPTFPTVCFPFLCVKG